MRVAIVLLVIGSLFAACGGTLPTLVATPELSAAQEQTHVPTPVPTPTEARSMPSPGDIGAPGACDQASGVDSYDVSSVATAPHSQLTYNIRVSGDDYHLQVTAKETGGPSGEVIGKNGTTYERETDGEWKQTDQYFPLGLLHLPHPIDGDSIVCPDLETTVLTRIGEEQLGTISVERFKITEGSDVGPLANVGGTMPDINPLDRTWDIWVDSSGQLMQTELTADYAATADYPQTRVTVRSIISGVGEPNIIAAPTLPTPTPTPTPTP